MHSEDGDEDVATTASEYSIFPTVAGVLLGAGLIWFMFELADGFA